MAESARIEELRRRVQRNPASISFAVLAEEYRRAGRFEEAIAICKAGLRRHPAYLSAHVTLGRSLLETGRYDEARAELEHVLRAAPENLAAIRALAEIHRRCGELPESGEYSVAPAVAPEAAAPELGRDSVVPGDDEPQREGNVTSPPAKTPLLPSTAPELATAAASREPHPDESALPALEAFLADIVRARDSADAIQSSRSEEQ